MEPSNSCSAALTMSPEALLTAAYAAFNARDIEAALELMSPDVAWPNGMEGGIVHGHDAVREYWTRQWKIINPRVEPIRIQRQPDGRYAVEVHQVVKELSGVVAADRVLHHIYQLREGLVASMEIKE
jgi:hypothetical protein